MAPLPSPGVATPPRSPTSRPTPSSSAARRNFAVFASILLVLVGAVYAPFLFGEKVLLYKGIGSDSLNEDYPNLVHLSEYIRATGVPLWSFQLGIGQTLYPFVSLLLFNPVAWLPAGTIAGALAWQQALKAVIAGLLFHRFLQLRGNDARGAGAGGALLACSAYVCIGACWSIAMNEVLGFVFLLLATEMSLLQGRWWWVSCAVGLLGLLTVFHLYLAAVFLLLYVPTRLIALHGWAITPMWRIGLPLGAAALLGCGLAGVVAVESGAMIFNSPRAPGVASMTDSLAAEPVFGFESAKYYLTCLMRWFSTDMLATGSRFRGWYNYFEAPANYCGLLTLVLVPQVFVHATRRQRILYLLFLAFVIVPVVFPWFRYAFWAFQGDYFRTFSLFRVLGVLTLGVTALVRISREQRLSLPVLIATTGALLGLLWIPTAEANRLVEPGLRIAATIYLILHGGLLAAGQLSRRHLLFTSLALLVAAVESVHFARITVAHRDVVTKAELSARTGYNDYTREAVADLKARDPGFYRVTKLYSSSPAIHASLNDDMVFGYFGTRSYSSFNDLDYIRFLSALDVVGQNPTETETRWAKGLIDRPLLSAFAAEKYLITREPEPLAGDPSYTRIAQHGDVHVFQSSAFVPLGLVQHQYIAQSEFLRWPASAKEHALFYAVVVPDEFVARAGTSLRQLSLDGLTRQVQETPLATRSEELRRSSLRLDSFDHNRIDGTVSTPQPAIVVVQTAFARGWKAYVDGKRVEAIRADVGLIGVPVPAGEHSVSLQYLPRFLPWGAAVSIVSLAALLFARFRWGPLRVH